jgi:hypothetical protein
LLKPAELKALGDVLKPVPRRKLETLYANAVAAMQVRPRGCHSTQHNARLSHCFLRTAVRDEPPRLTARSLARSLAQTQGQLEGDPSYYQSLATPPARRSATGSTPRDARTTSSTAESSPRPPSARRRSAGRKPPLDHGWGSSPAAGEAEGQELPLGARSPTPRRGRRPARSPGTDAYKMMMASSPTSSTSLSAVRSQPASLFWLARFFRDSRCV